jgi:catechol 1,2-dioxygenase
MGRLTEAAEIYKLGLNRPFSRIQFDFSLTKEVAGAPVTFVAREHAEAA